MSARQALTCLYLLLPYCSKPLSVPYCVPCNNILDNYTVLHVLLSCAAQIQRLWLLDCFHDQLEGVKLGVNRLCNKCICHCLGLDASALCAGLLGVMLAFFSHLSRHLLLGISLVES